MQILYSLIISIFFSGVFYYLINFALIPYTSDKVLDVKNLVIVSITLIISVTTLISFVHQTIDKFFFRKFYERPRLFLSLRRGFLVSITFVSIAWLKIFGLGEMHIVLLVIVLSLLIEALSMSLSGMEGGRKQTEDLEQEAEKQSNGEVVK
ncbi:hypothetical protein JW766_01470 [Candidatus Dojkabacteria bacterium]|nr:hypothetical protein [Candidatus Dojkabacteria bacterium]